MQMLEAEVYVFRYPLFADLVVTLSTICILTWLLVASAIGVATLQYFTNWTAVLFLTYYFMFVFAPMVNADMPAYVLTLGSVPVFCLCLVVTVSVGFIASWDVPDGKFNPHDARHGLVTNFAMHVLPLVAAGIHVASRQREIALVAASLSKWTVSLSWLGGTMFPALVYYLTMGHGKVYTDGITRLCGKTIALISIQILIYPVAMMMMMSGLW